MTLFPISDDQVFLYHIPLLIANCYLESNIRGPSTAEDQDSSTQEDPSTADTFDLFLSISPFVYFFRKIPLVVFIFSFIALSFGLIILSRWFQGNHFSGNILPILISNISKYSLTIYSEAYASNDSKSFILT